MRFIVLFVIMCLSQVAQAADEGSILRYLYPNAEPLVDYGLEQDTEFGDPYISHWDAVKNGPQPTIADIQARRQDWLDARVVEQTLETELDQLYVDLDALADDYDTLNPMQKLQIRRKQWRVWKLERQLRRR